MTEVTPEELALDVRHLTKTFGGVVALRDVSLWARRAEVTALVGDNGAGKSTLIKCVVGVHKPDSGDVNVFGSKLALGNPEDARRLGIETVYQDLSLVDTLSVVQNFYLGREVTKAFGPVRSLNRRAMTKGVDAALQALSVNVPSGRTKVRFLSGGQRQAVAIARAATFGKGLVIMDEPTASLGVQETAHVEETIRRLRAQGLPVLLISHDMQQVLRLSDYVWVLRSGSLSGGGPTRELDADGIVSLITGAKRSNQEGATQ